MATPKAWLLQTLAFSCFYYSMFADLHGIANTFFQLFSFILSITLTVLLVKHTKRHICKNILLAMIVVIPGFFLYAVYLLVSVVAWIFSVSKWKKELEILKHRI